eukprot:16114110-Heterocapsa_arctica.AAC.1
MAAWLPTRRLSLDAHGPEWVVPDRCSGGRKLVSSGNGMRSVPSFLQLALLTSSSARFMARLAPGSGLGAPLSP